MASLVFAPYNLIEKIAPKNFLSLYFLFPREWMFDIITAGIFYKRYQQHASLSSSGLGHPPFTQVTRVQIPLETLATIAQSDRALAF